MLATESARILRSEPVFKWEHSSGYGRCYCLLETNETRTGDSMSTNTLLIIIVLVLLLGGGGFYFR